MRKSRGKPVPVIMPPEATVADALANIPAFAEQDGKTKLTLKQTLFESVTSRDLHRGGAR